MAALFQCQHNAVFLRRRYPCKYLGLLGHLSERSVAHGVNLCASDNATDIEPDLGANMMCHCRAVAGNNFDHHTVGLQLAKGLHYLGQYRVRKHHKARQA